MPHRQFLCWREWLKERWNQPSRSDHYQMATTRAVLGSRAPLDDFKIPFGKPEPVEEPKKPKTPMAKTAAMGRFKYIRHRIVDKDGKLISEELISGGRRE